MGSMLNHRQIPSQQALRRLRIMTNVICNGRVAKLATQSAICTGLTAYYGSCALRRHICSNHIAKGVVYVADVTDDASRSGIAHVERITGTCNTRKIKTRLDLRVRDASTVRSDPLAPAHMHRNITAPRSNPTQDPWPPRWRRHTGDPTSSPQRSDGSKRRLCRSSPHLLYFHCRWPSSTAPTCTQNRGDMEVLCPRTEA